MARYERAPEDEWSFRVNVSLNDYEATYDLWLASLEKFRGGKTLRAFCEKFVEVAAPEKNGVRLTAEQFADEETHVILALGRDWDAGVRGVPLPLPVRSSDGEPSEDPTTSPES